MSTGSQQASAQNIFVITEPGPEILLPWFDRNPSDTSNAQTLSKILRSKPTFPWQFEQSEVTVLQLENGLIWLAHDEAMLSHDWQIELSGITELTLPDIGWQRIKAPLATATDCQNIALKDADLAACPNWFAAQQAHQLSVADMFRQNIVINSATLMPTLPAKWSEAALQHGFDLLATPDSADLYVSEINNQHWLQLFIPWSAFPPIDRQKLTQVYLKTKRCSKSGACSVGKLQGIAMKKAQSAALSLSRPLQIQLGSCANPRPTRPEDATFYRQMRGAKLMPNNSDAARKNHDQTWLISHAFTFINPGGGYLDRPDSARSSPEILWSDYRDRELSANVTLCQPQMALKIGDQVVPGTMPNFVEDHDNETLAQADSDLHGAIVHSQPGATPNFVPAYGNDYSELEIRPLTADRWLLLEPFHLIPPNSGEGVNGSCDTTSFSVWIADAQQVYLRQALTLGGYGPDLCAGSGVLYAHLSADGRLVHTASADNSGAETSESYCLDANTDLFFVCERTVRAANLTETR